MLSGALSGRIFGVFRLIPAAHGRQDEPKNKGTLYKGSL